MSDSTQVQMPLDETAHPPADTVSSSPNQIADTSAFISYLNRFVPALLNANQTAYAAHSQNSSTTDFEDFMNEKRSFEKLKKFLSDPQCRTLIIQKQFTSNLKPNSGKTAYLAVPCGWLCVVVCHSWIQL